jgi:hypothetical protein
MQLGANIYVTGTESAISHNLRKKLLLWDFFLRFSALNSLGLFTLPE